MWFLAGFLLVRYFRGLCLTVLVIVSLAFVDYSPLGWLPFLAVMTGWWWLRRSRLRRVARQEQAIADEQYRDDATARRAQRPRPARAAVR